MSDTDENRFSEGENWLVINSIIKYYTTGIFEGDGICMSESNEHDVSVSIVSHSCSSLSQSSTDYNGEHHTVLSSSQDLGGSVDKQSTGHQSDEDVCTKFTCGCKKVNGMPCSSLFSVEHYITLLDQWSLLTCNELDMVLLGSMMSTTLDDNHCC